MNAIVVVLFFVISTFVTGLFWIYSLSKIKNIPIIVFLAFTVLTIIASGISLIYARDIVSIHYLEYGFLGGVVFSSLLFLIFYNSFVKIGLINTETNKQRIIDDTAKTICDVLQDPIFTIKVKIADMDVHTFVISFLLRKREILQLDQKNFYMKYTGKIPDQNVEMQLISSDPLSVDVLRDSGAHIHIGNDDKPYICYPPQLQSIEDAKEVAQKWCIVTVFHMMYSADPNLFEAFGRYLLKKSKEDSSLNVFDEWVLWIKEKYDFQIEIS